MHLLPSFTLAVILALPSAASACRNWNLPSRQNFENYREVFAGEVVGVHLVEYEKLRKAQIRNGEVDLITVIDATPTFEVRALITHRYLGASRAVRTIRTGGCAVDAPATMESGLFFVLTTGRVQAVFSSRNPELYHSLLRAVRERYGNDR